MALHETEKRFQENLKITTSRNTAVNGSEIPFFTRQAEGEPPCRGRFGLPYFCGWASMIDLPCNMCVEDSLSEQCVFFMLDKKEEK